MSEQDEITINNEVIKTDRSEHLGTILEMYMRGIKRKDIASSLEITYDKVVKTLNSFRRDYLFTISNEGYIPKYSHLGDVSDNLNKPFYDLLSPSDSALSNEEMLYCALVVSTGNSVKAVIDSGLDAGMDPGTIEVYERNVRLRSELLKRKKNVQEEIRRLQVEREEIRDLTHDKLIQMHLEYAEQLKDEADPKNKSLIVKLFDQIAKLTGGYTHVIKTSEITADDVLDAQKRIMESELPPELQNLDDDGDMFTEYDPSENVSEIHSLDDKIRDNNRTFEEMLSNGSIN